MRDVLWFFGIILAYFLIPALLLDLLWLILK